LFRVTGGAKVAVMVVIAEIGVVIAEIEVITGAVIAESIDSKQYC
jgi:hypothetical protein